MQRRVAQPRPKREHGQLRTVRITTWSKQVILLKTSKSKQVGRAGSPSRQAERSVATTLPSNRGMLG